MSKNQPFVTFDHKKTQSRADKNHSFSRIAGFRFPCRDKIEHNLQSPNVHRTHSVLMESRFQRDQQHTRNQRRVNAIRQIFAIFCQQTIPSRSVIYLLYWRKDVNWQHIYMQDSLCVENGTTGASFCTYSIDVVTLILSSTRLRSES
jgi:hypothetical protein